MGVSGLLLTFVRRHDQPRAPPVQSFSQFIEKLIVGTQLTNTNNRRHLDRLLIIDGRKEEKGLTTAEDQLIANTTSSIRRESHTHPEQGASQEAGVYGPRQGGSIGGTQRNWRAIVKLGPKRNHRHVKKVHLKSYMCVGD